MSNSLRSLADTARMLNSYAYSVRSRDSTSLSTESDQYVETKEQYMANKEALDAMWDWVNALEAKARSDRIDAATMAKENANRKAARRVKQDGVWVPATSQRKIDGVWVQTSRAGHAANLAPPTNIADFKKPIKDAASVERTARTKWATLQAKVGKKIKPNELYYKDGKEFDHTTYNITWFMIQDTKLAGEAIKEFEARILKYEDIEAEGAIIIAQTAGTDEFYIESLEMESVVGQVEPIVTNLEMSVRSPYQADLIDNIFNASATLGNNNYTEFPTFLFIEWKAREHETQSAVVDIASRCMGVRFINMGMQYNEGGASYGVSFVRASEHNFNQHVMSLHEDITIKGIDVNEVITELLVKIQDIQLTGMDDVLIPDMYEIQLPDKYKAYKIIQPHQADYSTQRMASNYNIWKTKTDKGDPNVREVVEAPAAGNSALIGPKDSQLYFTDSQDQAVFTFKSGTTIVDIINVVLGSTKEVQDAIAKLLGASAQDLEAQKKRADPKAVDHLFIKVDADSMFLDYDQHRRQYATLHRYQVSEHIDPSYGTDEVTTQQDAGTSQARLDGIIGQGLLQRAYTYFYTGLNTEVKNVDFNFDNHWVMAKGLYSKMSSADRQLTGALATPDKHLRTHPDWNKLRIQDWEAEVVGLKKAITVQDNIANTTADKATFMAAKLQREAIEKELATAQEKLAAAQKTGLEEGTHKKITIVKTEGSMTGNWPSYIVPIKPEFTGQLYVQDLQQKTKEPGVMYPVSFVNTHVPPEMDKGFREDFDRGRNILAELYSKKLGGLDMITMDLEIRGDPYWITASYADNGEQSMSPTKKSPYLILLASQGNEPNTAGIMQINERNGLNAVYSVITVVSKFTGGEFSQTLNCVRDNTIDLNNIIRKPDEYIRAGIGGGR